MQATKMKERYKTEDSSTQFSDPNTCRGTALGNLERYIETIDRQK